MNNPLKFQISDKKQKGRFFPDFIFFGKILDTNIEVQIQVSEGDFEKHKTGQIVSVFQSELSGFVTAYEHDNQWIVKCGDSGFSFFLIPVILFFLIGLFSLISLVKMEFFDRA